MIVNVGTTNPAKLRAVKLSLEQLFPDIQPTVSGFNVASQVSDQPRSDEECIKGAINRARAAQSLSECDYAIGIEGGIHTINHYHFESGWIAVIKKDCETVGLGSSGRYLISHKIMKEIETGKELGTVIDEIMDMKDLKCSQGAMGLVTNGLVQRDTAYTHGILFAFGPFVSDPKLWH